MAQSTFCAEKTVSMMCLIASIDTNRSPRRAYPIIDYALPPHPLLGNPQKPMSESKNSVQAGEGGSCAAIKLHHPCSSCICLRWLPSFATGISFANRFASLLIADSEEQNG